MTKAKAEPLAFALEEFFWIGHRLERVAHIRKPHQPDRVFDVRRRPDVKRHPAGVRHLPVEDIYRPHLLQRSHPLRLLMDGEAGLLGTLACLIIRS